MAGTPSAMGTSSDAASPNRHSKFAAGLAVKSCANCDQDCPASEMCKWGRNGLSCHPCKTNYNRNNERLQKNSALREWWSKLTREEKVAWFVRNKQCYEPNKRHSFDDAG